MNRFLTALLITAAFFLQSQSGKADEIKVNSKISEVTVYRSMARESRNATINAPAGYFEVILSDISLSMIDQSLLVGVKGTAGLISATVRTNYFAEESEKESPQMKRLQDSINILGHESRWIVVQREIIADEIRLLQENRKLGTTQESIKPADLNALAELFRTRMNDLKKKDFDLERKSERINEKVAQYQAQLQEMGPRTKAPVKEIVLSLMADAAGPVNLKINYLVSAAGWSPFYDLRVESTAKPVALDYKAKVFQSTGYDWKDVKITVSTANPSRDNNRPILSPRFIDFVAYIPRKAATRGASVAAPAAAMNMMQLSKDDAEDVALDRAIPYQVNVEDNGMNVEFEIDIRQRISSDGKEHLCMLQKLEVPATYRYHAVPRLDPAAFLMARITNYGQYNLLSGQANVFFGEMYIGQVEIQPNAVSDTLLVSLGRDEKISVKRVKLVDKTSKKFFEDKQTETVGWEIIIRNNKTTAIDIEVLDQLPISKRKEIVVELQEKSGAEYIEDYGKILWNLKINANESKKLKLRYALTYPKGQQVQEF